MNKDKVILIFGASHGMGEFDKNMQSITHPGLSQYLQDCGHRVINLSGFGISNMASIKRAQDFFNANKQFTYSHVFFLQSVWTKDVHKEKWLPSIQDQDDEYKHGYKIFKSRQIARIYYRLSELYGLCSCKISVIGSSCDTIWEEKFSIEYPGVEIVCQSMMNLIFNNNHRTDDPIHECFEPQDLFILDNLSPYNKPEDKKLLLEDLAKEGRYMELVKSSEKYFAPDYIHTNREGHRVLFNFLKKQVKDL